MIIAIPFFLSLMDMKIAPLVFLDDRFLYISEEDIKVHEVHPLSVSAMNANLSDMHRRQLLLLKCVNMMYEEILEGWSCELVVRVMMFPMPG